MASPPGEDFIGTVTALGPDSIRLAVDRSESLSPDTVLSVPLNQVNRVAVSRGTGSRGSTGLLIGWLTGALGGVVFGVATADYECRTGIFYQNGFRRETRCTGQRPAQRALIVGLLSGLGGSAVGLGIGSMIRVERWERVRLALLPQAKGTFSLSGSVTF